MITVRIAVDKNGNLKSLKAEGHSLSAPKGNNIVCSAVSALLRSALRALRGRNGCEAIVNAEHDGFLQLEIGKVAGLECWLSGISDMLIAGLLEIEQEYPAECRIELTKLS